MKKIIYILIVSTWACNNQQEYITNNLIEKEFISISLIDTFKNELKLDSASSITEAEYHPMYMGISRDSIELIYWSGENEYRTDDWGKYKRHDSTDLEIFVDTSKIIGSVNRYFIPPPPPPNYEEEANEKWERKYFRGEKKSHPIFIKNLSKDTLNIGYGEYIPLIIEAKDSLGNWEPIQEPYIYGCGTGLTKYYLPPNEITITSCKLFKGDFETTMRVAFGFDRIVRSNEFKGKINYNQFDKMKEEYY